MNKKIANMIDHTILKATATKEDVIKLCKEAKEYGFFSVCINPANIELAKAELKGYLILPYYVININLFFIALLIINKKEYLIYYNLHI